MTGLNEDTLLWGYISPKSWPQLRKTKQARQTNNKNKTSDHKLRTSGCVSLMHKTSLPNTRLLIPTAGLAFQFETLNRLRYELLSIASPLTVAGSETLLCAHMKNKILFFPLAARLIAVVWCQI